MTQQLVALITGAGKGAGRATAKALAGGGYTVVGVSRTATELNTLASEISQNGGIIETYIGDVGDEESAQQIVGLAIDKFDRIDALIHNAAIGVYGRVDSYSLDDWNDSIRTNLTGVFLLTKYAISHLLSSHGKIIAIGSGAALQGYAGKAAYCTTKFGLRGFMQSIALDFPEVKCSTILPGNILTTFSGKSIEERIQSGQNFLQPEDVAEAVLYLLRQSSAAWTQEMSLWPFRR